MEFNSTTEQPIHRDFNSNLFPNNKHCFHKCHQFEAYNLLVQITTVEESCSTESAFRSAEVGQYSREGLRQQEHSSEVALGVQGGKTHLSMHCFELLDISNSKM